MSGTVGAATLPARCLLNYTHPSVWDYWLQLPSRRGGRVVKRVQLRHPLAASPLLFLCPAS